MNDKHKKKVLLPLALIVAFLCLLLGLLIACTQPEERAALINVFLNKDSEPPILLAVNSVASSIVKIDFNEPVKVYGNTLGKFVARADGKSVYVTLDSSLPAGVQTNLEGRVQDYYGNTTGFSVAVWGYNPNVPKLLINEFTTQKDERNPDRTELYATSGGNLAGVTIYCGTPNDYDAKFMFPDVDIQKGDYIVVWWVDENYDESKIKNSGKNFLSKTKKNPSNNNGVIVLSQTPSPGASIMDAVVYSNFGESMDGFGTSTARDRATWTIKSGEWIGDAIDTTYTTPTRSMSRKLGANNKVSEDTNTNADWYIACSGGATFGSANTSEPYEP